MSQTPDTSTVDALSHAARAAGSDLDAQTALWQAMFELDQWYFVARGTLPDVAPLVGVVDGVPSLLAFTTGPRAREFALGNGFSEEEASQVLGVPTGSVLDLCEQFTAQGVDRLVVDQGVLGFFAPLPQLRPIHEFINRPRRVPPG
ncbi:MULTISPECIES: hypothetical protein [unclassified Knoellia]|uniref:hypothetical protein n=1 Tax=Knoellia altitudinis TaxID=3404795 RepID=UPI0036219C7A